jgi:hypothetical protein
MSSQRLRTVSAVPRWGQALLVPVPAEMRCHLDWQEEQVVLTALRPL